MRVRGCKYAVPHVPSFFDILYLLFSYVCVLFCCCYTDVNFEGSCYLGFDKSEKNRVKPMVLSLFHHRDAIFIVG